MGFLDFAVEEAVVLEGLTVGEGVFVIEFWVTEVSMSLFGIGMNILTSS